MLKTVITEHNPNQLPITHAVIWLHGLGEVAMILSRSCLSLACQRMWVCDLYFRTHHECQ